MEANAKVLCQVLQEDIILGKANNTQYCPVARAISRKCHGRPSVASDFGLLGYGGADCSGKLPDYIQTFINKFDQGVTVRPTSFYIDVPVEFVK